MQINVKIPPALINRVDQFIAGEGDGPSRPEAIRRLIERALDAAE